MSPRRGAIPAGPRPCGPRPRVALLSLLLGLLMAAPAPGQAPHLEILHEKLERRLDRIADSVPGVMGVAVVDLTSGASFGVNRDLVFPQGSAIKIPVLIELFRQAEAGRLRLDESVEIRRGEMVGGSGVLQHFGDGSSALSLRDLAVLMIVLSDNTATNLLIERVGMERVNVLMARLDSPGTRLRRVMIRPEDSAAGRENVSTPAEAAALMARIARCDLPIDSARCAELRSILEIPKRGPLADPVPGDVAVAWKPGGITGVTTAWGIVELPGRPYALVAMVNYSDGAAAGEAIRRASDAVYDHFRRLAGATEFGARVPLRYLPGRDSVRDPLER